VPEPAHAHPFASKRLRLVIRIGLPLSARYVPPAAQAQGRQRWRWRSVLRPIPRVPTGRGARFRIESCPRPVTRVQLQQVRLPSQYRQPEHFPEKRLPSLVIVVLPLPCRCRFRWFAGRCRPTFHRARSRLREARAISCLCDREDRESPSAWPRSLHSQLCVRRRSCGDHLRNRWIRKCCTPGSG
jgi:hypothetical protein